MASIAEENRAKAEPEVIEPIHNQELFRDFVEQNWNHIRHLETIRTATVWHLQRFGPAHQRPLDVLVVLYRNDGALLAAVLA